MTSTAPTKTIKRNWHLNVNLASNGDYVIIPVQHKVHWLFLFMTPFTGRR